MPYIRILRQCEHLSIRGGWHFADDEFQLEKTIWENPNVANLIRPQSVERSIAALEFCKSYIFGEMFVYCLINSVQDLLVDDKWVWIFGRVFHINIIIDVSANFLDL